MRDDEALDLVYAALSFCKGEKILTITTDEDSAGETAEVRFTTEDAEGQRQTWVISRWGSFQEVTG